MLSLLVLFKLIYIYEKMLCKEAYVSARISRLPCGDFTFALLNISFVSTNK